MNDTTVIAVCCDGASLNGTKCHDHAQNCTKIAANEQDLSFNDRIAAGQQVEILAQLEAVGTNFQQVSPSFQRLRSTDPQCYGTVKVLVYTKALYLLSQLICISLKILLVLLLRQAASCTTAHRPGCLRQVLDQLGLQ